MFVDSHCHLDLPEFQERLPDVLATMAAEGVEHALCVSITLEAWPRIRDLVRAHPGLLSASVGVHPDYLDVAEPTVVQLVELAMQPEVVAIGETGRPATSWTGSASVSGFTSGLPARRKSR